MTNSSALALQLLLIVFIVLLVAALVERYIERSRKRLYIRYQFCGIKCAHPVEDIAHAQRISNCLDMYAMTDVQVVTGTGRVTHRRDSMGFITHTGK